MDTLTGGAMTFPHREVPPGGEIVKVAEGVWWVRMPLPFKLDHINLWLVEDGEGFAIVDTGINLPEVRELWEKIFAQQLGGRPITRVLCTHMHPDHLGLGGWLTERWKARLWITLGEYLSAQTARIGFGREENASRRGFYRSNGMAEERLDLFDRHRGSYASIVGPLPVEYQRLRDGETFTMGGRQWRVIVCLGHAPEHASFYCAELGVLIAGDQVLPKITTNVSVWPMEPLANALQWFLDGIVKLRQLPADTLVLPSHGLPFSGLHARLDQLAAHHDERLGALREACGEAGERGATGVEMVPVLFPRQLDDHQFVFALGETLAHLHCLEGRGQARRVTDRHGIHHFAAA